MPMPRFSLQLKMCKLFPLNQVQRKVCLQSLSLSHSVTHPHPHTCTYTPMYLHIANNATHTWEQQELSCSCFLFLFFLLSVFKQHSEYEKLTPNLSGSREQQQQQQQNKKQAHPTPNAAQCFFPLLAFSMPFLAPFTSPANWPFSLACFLSAKENSQSLKRGRKQHSQLNAPGTKYCALIMCML